MKISARLIAFLSLLSLLVCVPGCNGNSSNDSSTAALPGNSKNTGGTESFEVRLHLIREMLKRGEVESAHTHLKALLVEQPDNPKTLVVAASVSFAAGEFDEAEDLFRHAAKHDKDGITGILIAGSSTFAQAGMFDKAEGLLQLLVTEKPLSVEAHRALTRLYNEEGRRHSANRHALALARFGAATSQELLTLTDGSGPYANGSLRKYDVADREGRTSPLHLALARVLHFADRNTDEALRVTKRLIRDTPENLEAYALHGFMLSIVGTNPQMKTWHESAPVGADSLPEYWTAIGVWRNRTRQYEAAIGACVSALRLDPTERTALRTMVAALRKLSRDEDADRCSEGLLKLDELFERTGKFAAQPSNEAARDISTRMRALNRLEEALGWKIVAATLSGTMKAEMDTLVAERKRLLKQDPREALAFKKLVPFDVSEFKASASSKTAPRISSDDKQSFALVDVAQQVGLDVQFHSGNDPDSGVFRLHQANGGGLGAIDFDQDGRIDFYIAQSDGPPNDSAGSKPNALMRASDLGFANVSRLAGTGDRSLAQGIAIGDVNQDGLPDICIANIGANVLLINQGDGTFQEQSQPWTNAPATWTSSIAIADLSGDHLPEIIEINYVDDPTAFTEECRKFYDSCAPGAFRAATDRIFQATDAGEYRVWSQWESAAESLDERRTYGFSPVVANFDHQHGNDLFIANDAKRNHYWRSVPGDSDANHRFQLEEVAQLTGCTIGANGLNQACMGVAAGDFDRNGFIDLHITNFHNEPVNLFMQFASGTFTDETLAYDLHGVSEKILGFGSQAADFNNDGWLDIAVLNGHIYDATHQDVPYRMKPQLLSGGPAKFVLHEPADPNSYWDRPQLGRTLIRTDWNRDGRVDLVATHMDHPVALLENRTEKPGNWLQLELVGTMSERDAVGADLMIRCGNDRWHTARFAGDGYMCSNEATVFVAVGAHRRVDELTIRWPSGDESNLTDVDVNRRYLIIENRDGPVVRSSP